MLVAVSRPLTRRRRGPLVLIAGLAAAGLLLGVAGARTSTTLALQGASDEELVSALADLERELPDLPPESVVIDEDETFADLVGDFENARFSLDRVSGELRQLFVRAEDSEGEAAAAVADAARALLELLHAYEFLADFEAHDIQLPLNTTDDLGTATGADEARGLAESGLRLWLEAQDRALPAYTTLRNAAAVPEGDRDLFERRFVVVERTAREVVPRVRRALSLSTVQLLETDQVRFERRSPQDAPARVLTAACLDREAYEELLRSGELPDAEQLESLAEASDVGSVDCPDLPNDNRVERVELTEILPGS